MNSNTLRRGVAALLTAASLVGAITQASAETLRIGYQKYGSGYQSLTYLLRQHIYGAAKRDCDHWHDGVR